MNYQDYFKGKKITQLGLGLLGRGVGDAEFLASCGAELIVTDLKSEADLKPSLERLKKFPNIKFVLGGHRLEDFRGRDFILKAAGVPIDSPYIAEARKNNIPIEMDASLFAKLSGQATIIGITGTRGKSTTTMLIYEILRRSGYRTFLGGNIKDTATLPILEKLNEDGEGDYVVLELDSWQLQGFGEAKLSPRVSVFTTFYSDHMNYYKNSMEAYFADKANIFKYQTEKDFLVVGEEVADRISGAKSKIIVAGRKDVPKSWSEILLGEHNLLNLACAIKAVKCLGLKMGQVKSAVKYFRPLAGRLEFLKEISGVLIYNDTNATTPEATLAGLKALGAKKKIVLIMGGFDKGLDMSGLVRAIPQFCKSVVLLDGTGSRRLAAENPEVAKDWLKAGDLKTAVDMAMKAAGTGETVLFSPAFASFGMFKNEYDRGERFVSEISGLTGINSRV